MMEKKKILFLTGTRADYGKMKPLMQAMEQDEMFEVYIFVCGMHLVERFGSTYREILKDKYTNVYVAYGLGLTQNASINLGNTVCSLAGYVENIKPDMIVVHGDRMDALAGAMVGALHNVVVAHIEGGEVSGTIDESIRHAISKFAHVHFVCNEDAKMRLIQMGEEKERIYVIGSPDIDIMMSENLPTIEMVKARYDISFDNYAVLMYHPVTTEYESVGKKIEAVVNAVLESRLNYVVVYPNNDLGSEVILNEYARLKQDSHLAVFPSLRFEYFLTLLKQADFIIGNSSAGIRESGIYGVPAIDIGTRQSGRYSENVIKNIQHTDENEKDILQAIRQVEKYRKVSFVYGNGNSTDKFMEVVHKVDFWDLKIQKKFIDYEL